MGSEGGGGGIFQKIAFTTIELSWDCYFFFLFSYLVRCCCCLLCLESTSADRSRQGFCVVSERWLTFSTLCLLLLKPCKRRKSFRCSVRYVIAFTHLNTSERLFFTIRVRSISFGRCYFYQKRGRNRSAVLETGQTMGKVGFILCCWLPLFVMNNEFRFFIFYWRRDNQLQSGQTLGHPAGR